MTNRTKLGRKSKHNRSPGDPVSECMKTLISESYFLKFLTFRKWFNFTINKQWLSHASGGEWRDSSHSVIFLCCGVAELQTQDCRAQAGMQYAWRSLAKKFNKKMGPFLLFPIGSCPHTPYVALGRLLTISALGSYIQKNMNLSFFPSSVTLMWFSAARASTRSLFGICAASSQCKLIWYVSTTVVQTITNCGNDG